MLVHIYILFLKVRKVLQNFSLVNLKFLKYREVSIPVGLSVIS